jgi:hypothetical protein
MGYRMSEADWEAKRQREEREREQGLAFSQTLREKFAAMSYGWIESTDDSEAGGDNDNNDAA